MPDEPTYPHFARPVHFGSTEDCDCAICESPIYLHENPDGRKMWRHREDA